LTSESSITRIDMLQMLLLAGGSEQPQNEPIVGKTRLQKELFLVHKSLRSAGFSLKSYSFKPYHYGPYCKDIYQDIDWLVNKGIVEERSVQSSYSGIISMYVLTPQGVEQTQRLILDMDLEEAFNIIQEDKNKYNSMDVVDLVEFTHKVYPEYIG
jgi:uncharacterized protein YwgA